MTEAKYASEAIFTKDTPYLALTGELWGVFCADLSKNWSRYNGTALYYLANRIAAPGASQLCYWLSTIVAWAYQGKSGQVLEKS